MTAIPPEPPEEPPVPPPPAPGAEGVVCPRCGTPSDPYQEYCLECGLRLPMARGVVAYLSHTWRRNVPWYPGDWVWPVVAALVIAVLAGGGAIIFTEGNGGNDTRVATGPATLPEDTVPEETVPTDTGVEPPPTDTEPVEPPPPTQGGIVEWPPGQTGYTIVLASLPESSGRGPAVGAAQRAADQGLTDVGALNSSEYSSLHPGYWVVFSGVYDTLEEARSGLDTARASYPQAYTRQIVP